MTSETTRTEIIFLFDTLPDWQVLQGSIPDSMEVVVLDGQGDGLAQIVDWLEGRSGIDALHLLSHGDVGKIQLGNRWLDSSSVVANQTLLTDIGSALSEEGDILLYGCRVAEDGAGANFIKALADATGADVAASRDMTGASVLGGNWSLEAVEGVVQAVALEMPSFENVLAAFSDPFSADIGSTTSFTSILGGFLSPTHSPMARLTTAESSFGRTDTGPAMALRSNSNLLALTPPSNW
jgi:hypothetical protein